MAERKFKVGDKVRGIRGDIEDCEGVILADTGSGFEIKFTKMGNRHWQQGDGWNVGNTIKRSTYWDGCLELIESGGERPKLIPPRFILQYELDKDPFELFATEKEVRTRIKELAERHDLKRDSIKVYEIKNVRAVKLGTSIKFIK
jgi:hypothetical protein